MKVALERARLGGLLLKAPKLGWILGFTALVGAIAGPAIGGPLTDISLRAPFFVYAGTLAVAGTIGMVFLTRTSLHERVIEGDSPWAELARTTVWPRRLSSAISSRAPSNGRVSSINPRTC